MLFAGSKEFVLAGLGHIQTFTRTMDLQYRILTEQQN